jgi:Na+/H+-dicarboxylate symporter
MHSVGYQPIWPAQHLFSVLPSPRRLALTFLGALCGIFLGSMLRLATLSPQAIDLIGFPGEVMLRLLKLMVLPLVSVSMVAGLCSLRTTGGTSRLGLYTGMWYFFSTVIAILLGVVLVLLIHPGRNAAFQNIGCGEVEGPPGGGTCCCCFLEFFKNWSRIAAAAFYWYYVILR